MVNAQILQYVRQQLASGVSAAELTKALVGQGWSEADSAEAISAVTGSGAVPPLPPPAPPAAPVSPIANPISSTPPASHLAFVQLLSSRTLIALALVLVCIGGAGYAYASGALDSLSSYIPFLAHAPYSKDQVLTGVAQGLSQIHTSSWDISFHINTEPRDAGAIPFDAGTTTDAELLSFVPANFDLLLDLNGAADRSGATPNARAAVSASLTSEDFTAAIAAEFRKVGDNFYGVVTKIPGIFGNFSAIKNKWVVVTPDDLKKYASVLALGNFSQHTNDEQQQAQQRLQTLLELEHTYHVFASADPVQTNLSGASVWEYDLTLNAPVFADFYAAARDAFKDDATTSAIFSQKTLDYLRSDEGQRYLSYISHNVVLHLWVGTDGVPRNMDVSVRLVPPDSLTKLANEQVRAVATLSFVGINQPVSIEAPTSTISINDAYQQLFGSSLDDYIKQGNDGRRVADLQQLKYALQLYYRDHGSYPGNTVFLAPQYISKVPLDPVDQSIYSYTSTGVGYTLSANMETKQYAAYVQKGVTFSSVSCSGESNGRFCYRIKQ